MKSLIFKLLFLSAAVVLPAAGEVFWKTPRDQTPISELIPGAGNVLFRDKSNVNGVPVEIEVSRPEIHFNDLNALFAKWKTPHKPEYAGDTIRFRRKLSDGTVERLLIVFSGKEKATVCFRMVTPEKLPAPGEWPRELPPLPPGAEAVQVTRLGTGGVLGEFQHAGNDPEAVRRAADAHLRAVGFLPADTPAPGAKNSGGFYVSFKPKAAAYLSVDPDGRGYFFFKRMPDSR